MNLILNFVIQSLCRSAIRAVLMNSCSRKYCHMLPMQLRTLEEITADIRAVEQETDGLLDEILGGTL